MDKFEKAREKCPAYRLYAGYHECGAQMLRDGSTGRASFEICAEKSCPVLYWVLMILGEFAREIIGDEAVDEIIGKVLNDTI